MCGLKNHNLESKSGKRGVGFQFILPICISGIFFDQPIKGGNLILVKALHRGRRSVLIDLLALAQVLERLSNCLAPNLS